MAGKEVYIIRVEGKAVEVTPEIYYTYFHREHQERGQEERRAEMLSYLMTHWITEISQVWNRYRI